MRAVVTALMPVKEYHERFLLEAVDSLLTQTDPDWRLLVIGEGSVRRALSDLLAERLADPRIELIDNEGRKLAGAFNTGMRRAETEFVAIVLGDDLWAPAAVEVLRRSVGEHPDADFFHSSRRVIDERGEALSSVYESRPGDVSPEDFGGASPVKHLLCWNRRKALEIGGMDESLNSVGVDDFDFPWMMAERGTRFQAIPDCLYLYRAHRESFRLTTHLPRSHHRREITRIMRKHGVAEERIADHLAHAERGYLRQCLYESRPRRWINRLLGQDPPAAPREKYR